MAVIATVATLPLRHPGRERAARDVHLAQHPAAENVAVSVHVGRLRNGPYDRIAATFGHQFLTGCGCFHAILLPYPCPTGHPAIPSRGRGKTRSRHGTRTAISSIGLAAASVPRDRRKIPTRRVTSRCWKGWSPSASAPACISAAPTNGPCIISWPRCSTMRWTRPSPAMPTRSGSRCCRATTSRCATMAAACRSIRIRSSRTSRRWRSSSPRCIRAASSTARSTRRRAACMASASRW